MLDFAKPIVSSVWRKPVRDICRQKCESDKLQSRREIEGEQARTSQFLSYLGILNAVYMLCLVAQSCLALRTHGL